MHTTKHSCRLSVVWSDWLVPLHLRLAQSTSSAGYDDGVSFERKGHSDMVENKMLKGGIHGRLYGEEMPDAREIEAADVISLRKYGPSAQSQTDTGI